MLGKAQRPLVSISLGENNDLENNSRDSEMNLMYRNEKLLFKISVVIAAIFWLALVLGTAGIVLIWLLFGFLIYLFTHSAFIAHIKGSGMRINSQQLPELYKQYQACCEKIGIQAEPDLYVLNANGILNALATKFMRKKYVVLYSSVIDALKKYPGAINFYIGHELGHIQRGHLNWATLIWPATVLPVLGSAYFRAREYTCDLHGLHCCSEVKEAAYALSVLAVGPEYWSKINLNEYVKQCEETGGFWMSFHEFVGDYPWLCKRVQHVITASQGKPPAFPRRSSLAFLLSIFVPRLGVGGGAGGLVSVMIVVAVIGILAAVALPAYQDYTVRAKVAQVDVLAEEVKAKATPYIIENDTLPYDLNMIQLPVDLANDVVAKVDVTDRGFLFHLTGPAQIEGETVLYEPYYGDDSHVYWRCSGGSLSNKYRSVNCRE